MDVHLRQRMPRRAHRSGAGAGYRGACSYEAPYFTSGKKDARNVERAAAELTPDIWQFHKQGQKGVVKKLPDGDLGTRLVQGACIFLDRPGFPAGPGCALHLAAMAQNRSHVELKPDVCWQLPLRREDETSLDGHVTSVIRQWDRRHWGGGGEEFHWWCTEAPEAFVGHEPVTVAMQGRARGHGREEGLEDGGSLSRCASHLARRRCRYRIQPSGDEGIR